jgi:uncharacterized glyoxalase superfamily protein PhnB
MTLGATLYLVDSIEAVRFYCESFGMTVGYNARHDDGSYLHAELLKDGASIFAVSESDDEASKGAMMRAKQPTMSLGINLNDDGELRHAYDALKEDGHVLRPIGSLPWSPLSADVVDKFGVCWYLYVSQHKPDDTGK